MTVTVSGVGQASGTAYSDAFYIYTDGQGNPITPVHPPGPYNYTLWINNGPADVFVSPIPAYAPQHVYTFSIAAPGGSLRFAIGDEGSGDNTGEYTVKVTPQLAAMRFTSPPTIDGYLDDWSNAYSQVLNGTTANYYQWQLPSPSDASTTIRAGWDDTSLYFAFQVTDDVFIADSEEIWRDDSVQVALDGANDNTGNNADDHDLVAAADGRLLDFGITPVDGARVSVKSSGGANYSIEMAVDKSLVGGSLAIDRILGVNIGLVDDDDGGQADSWLIWAGQYANQGQADFIDLRLLGQSWNPSAPPPGYWSQTTSNTTAWLRGLQMRSATEGWAVGSNGKVLRYNGNWQNVNMPETRDLY
ncbi:MAG: hypothetical protein KDH08_16385, partial [Anaerolineae bacterium]|nr:hypothetical protein [Anaerolineae bacterium]